jgi:hypothetical protein
MKFLIFFKKFYKVNSVEVLSQDPVIKNNSKYEVKIWAMCAQLDLEVRSKRPQKKRRPSNFH